LIFSFISDKEGNIYYYDLVEIVSFMFSYRRT